MNQDKINETVKAITGAQQLVEATGRAVSVVIRQMSDAVDDQTRQMSRIVSAAEEALGSAEGEDRHRLRRLIDETMVIKSLLSGAGPDQLQRVCHNLRDIGTTLEGAAIAVSRIEPTE